MHCEISWFTLITFDEIKENSFTVDSGYISLYSALNKLKNNFERYSSDLEAIKKLIDNEVDFMIDTYDDYQEFTNKFIFIVWDTTTLKIK